MLRHDNGTQFTSEHYREVATRLGIQLSRSRYRHSDGNALVERVFLSVKQEEVWPQDFASFAEASRAVRCWILDYRTRKFSMVHLALFGSISLLLILLILAGIFKVH